jgi:hypothetical protein
MVLNLRRNGRGVEEQAQHSISMLVHTAAHRGGDGYVWVMWRSARWDDVERCRVQDAGPGHTRIRQKRNALIRRHPGEVLTLA